MKPFNVGQYVNTPDGIGRILYLTDYQRQNGATEATSAVVLFGISANKYPVSTLSPSTQEAHQASQKPKLLYVAIDLEPQGAEKIAQI